MLLLSNHMIFSHNHFYVYDNAVDLPGLDWTDLHIQQGFARRPSTVGFSTLVEFGTATLRVYGDGYAKNKLFQRVISVPFESITGEILIEGPEEFDVNRSIFLEVGHYELFVAQKTVSSNPLDAIQEEIEIFFVKTDDIPLRSKIIVADENIDSSVLTETAETMDVS